MSKNVQELRSKTLKHPRLMLYSFLLGTAFSSGLIAQDQGDLVKVEQIEQETASEKREQQEQIANPLSKEEAAKKDSNRKKGKPERLEYLAPVVPTIEELNALETSSLSAFKAESQKKWWEKYQFSLYQDSPNLMPSLYVYHSVHIILPRGEQVDDIVVGNSFYYQAVKKSDRVVQISRNSARDDADFRGNGNGRYIAIIGRSGLVYNFAVNLAVDEVESTEIIEIGILDKEKVGFTRS